MAENWQSAVLNEWRRRRDESLLTNSFPLVERTFDGDEIIALIDTVLSGKLTMGDRVREFEQKFAQYVSVCYSLIS